LYLKKLLLLNSGPISDVEIDAEFDSGGNPKPIILLGKNGNGKTNLLSTVTDAMIEFAAKAYDDISPSQPSGGRYYYRALNGTLRKVGAPYELAVLEFGHQTEVVRFV